MQIAVLRALINGRYCAKTMGDNCATSRIVQKWYEAESGQNSVQKRCKKFSAVEAGWLAGRNWHLHNESENSHEIILDERPTLELPRRSVTPLPVTQANLKASPSRIGSPERRTSDFSGSIHGSTAQNQSGQDPPNARPAGTQRLKAPAPTEVSRLKRIAVTRPPPSVKPEIPLVASRRKHASGMNHSVEVNRS